ncbi:unnamed protein product [Nezara viridula]|uniref:Uncharacterized protein n=1 Tax=Nezara viridula TaxID=85310 RepID=A0A9P0HRI1_NEZVI|nr:unnamed protein product [Nezara viridula]
MTPGAARPDVPYTHIGRLLSGWTCPAVGRPILGDNYPAGRGTQRRGGYDEAEEARFCGFRSHHFRLLHSFVNSQEWTVARSVPDLRLGIVGSVSSGKSALVHRYLTGSYMQEESPEGGRFKKEVLMDGHSHLLLIRDEGGPPELQVSSVPF